ncbi:hypothetical protein OSB04_003312 [Centaurea solstitialis]|uniref:t-SNARE coiled-coil homology domain-containing protein n=1 Tax=Centaurea solstitialis TaxID=347529 RepID=A0AA38U751_9ASTR|nr:hypothetical protein OSB04_003312 [Centaurea solstitialis]
MNHCPHCLRTLGFRYRDMEIDAFGLITKRKGVDGMNVCLPAKSSMFGLKRPHLHKTAKQNSVDPRLPSQPSANPFDSDDEIDKKSTLKPSQRASSQPSLSTPNSTISLFDDNEVKGVSSGSGYTIDHASRNKYKNDFVDSGGVENQSVQELEHYAAYKAEETTKTVHSALKIAEDIREGATNTMLALHQQGEQINRTHMAAADIEQDLGRGEKLLGSLGGIFSRTWKPKKGQAIKGPTNIRDDPDRRKGNHLEQREKLGLTTTQNKGSSRSRTPPPESSEAMQKVEYEKAKQDDGLSDLSDILGELKEMAVDMGSEIERQNKALNPLQDDIEEINFRVKGANQRTRLVDCHATVVNVITTTTLTLLPRSSPRGFSLTLGKEENVLERRLKLGIENQGRDYQEFLQDLSLGTSLAARGRIYEFQ